MRANVPRIKNSVTAAQYHTRPCIRRRRHLYSTTWRRPICPSCVRFPSPRPVVRKLQSDTREPRVIFGKRARYRRRPSTRFEVDGGPPQTPPATRRPKSRPGWKWLFEKHSSKSLATFQLSLSSGDGDGTFTVFSVADEIGTGSKSEVTWRYGVVDRRKEYTEEMATEKIRFCANIVHRVVRRLQNYKSGYPLGVFAKSGP